MGNSVLYSKSNCKVTMKGVLIFLTLFVLIHDSYESPLPDIVVGNTRCRYGMVRNSKGNCVQKQTVKPQEKVDYGKLFEKPTEKPTEKPKPSPKPVPETWYQIIIQCLKRFV